MFFFITLPAISGRLLSVEVLIQNRHSIVAAVEVWQWSIQGLCTGMMLLDYIILYETAQVGVRLVFAF